MELEIDNPSSASTSLRMAAIPTDVNVAARYTSADQRITITGTHRKFTTYLYEQNGDANPAKVTLWIQRLGHRTVAVPFVP